MPPEPWPLPQTPHLARRGRIWWWRRALPRRLRRAGGPVELRRSTRTHLIAATRARANLLDAAADRAFAILEQMMTGQPLDPSTARRVLAETFQLYLEIWEDLRADEAISPTRALGNAMTRSDMAALWQERLATNDLEEVDDYLAPILRRLGLGLAPSSPALRRLRRDIARALIHAEAINAERDHGCYREDGEVASRWPALGARLRPASPSCRQS